MVIAHFFTRKSGGRTLLMCETSVSGDSESPWKAPRVMFEVGQAESVAAWTEQAKVLVARAHPDHEIADIAVPPGRRAFDITLKKPGKPGPIRRLINGIKGKA